MSPDGNRPGYVQNYNFTIQYLLPMSTVFEVAFVGNKGTRLWGFGQYDVNPASKLAMGDVLLDPVSSHPQYSPYAGFPTDQTVAQAILPYPQYYQVNEFFPYNSGSNYNALQISATKHLTKGLGFLLPIRGQRRLVIRTAWAPQPMVFLRIFTTEGSSVRWPRSTRRNSSS